MAFFLETLLGGLMAGMLYSLVALGFVLIFKASGVFNFAQGAMVLFAALAMARFAEWVPGWPAWTTCSWPTIGLPAGRAHADVPGGLADRAAGAAPSGQPGRRDAADGHAGHHLLARRPGPDHLRQRHLQDRRRHAQGSVFLLEGVFPGGVLVNKEDVIAAGIAACWWRR
jgi:branched-chain amino acid transport system permease protein